jgi:hypothetical protein
VFGPKYDDDVGRLGLVRRQVIRVPVGKVYNLPRRSPCLSRLGRFHDVESVPVEEESMIPEQFAQLWNYWMIVGKGLASNWLRVRSISAEVNLITHSFFDGARARQQNRTPYAAGPPTFKVV